MIKFKTMGTKLISHLTDGMMDGCMHLCDLI